MTATTQTNHTFTRTLVLAIISPSYIPQSCPFSSRFSRLSVIYR